MKNAAFTKFLNFIEFLLNSGIQKIFKNLPYWFQNKKEQVSGQILIFNKEFLKIEQK